MNYYIYPDKKHILLTSFSVYTNGKNLLKTNRHYNSINCLDGLRYISICWIIYGHTYYTEVVGVKMNLNEILQVTISKISVAFFFFSNFA